MGGEMLQLVKHEEEPQKTYFQGQLFASFLTPSRFCWSLFP